MVSGILFGAGKSTCSQRVYVVAFDVGAEITLSPVDFASGEHKKEPHTFRHPFGRIPALETSDGVKIYESRAIAKYLDAKSGGKLTQINNLEKYAFIETWISNEQSYFDKYAAFWELVFKQKFTGGSPNHEEVAKLKSGLIPNLDVYEQELSKRKFLTGDEYTIADLFHLPYGAHLFRVLPELFDNRPHLKQWFQTLTELPAWKKTLEFGEKYEKD